MIARRLRRVVGSSGNQFSLVVSAAIIALLPATIAAQSTGRAHRPEPHTTEPSTLSAMFTEEQAARGKDVYAGNCKSCHTPASHTGATFAKWWRGKRLSDLFGYVSTKMPKNDPGSLSSDDAADVVAFLLKMNAMPSGKDELPGDLDSLKHVRIETMQARRTTPAKRRTP